MTKPGGTGNPERIISPREAPFPPAIFMSDLDTSVNQIVAIILVVEIG